MALSIGNRSRSILNGTHTPCPCSTRSRSKDIPTNLFGSYRQNNTETRHVQAGNFRATLFATRSDL
jgi:hypothetical protein